MSNDNNIETRIFRDRDGWNATSEMDLTGDQLLKIRSYRNDRGLLRTSATVHTKVEGGLRHIMGFGTSGGDFSETLVVTKPARVTEKVISAQHESVLKTIPGILSAVQAHYAKFPVSPALA